MPCNLAVMHTILTDEVVSLHVEAQSRRELEEMVRKPGKNDLDGTTESGAEALVNVT